MCGDLWGWNKETGWDDGWVGGVLRLSGGEVGGENNYLLGHLPVELGRLVHQDPLGPVVGVLVRGIGRFAATAPEQLLEQHRVPLEDRSEVARGPRPGCEESAHGHLGGERAGRIPIRCIINSPLESSSYKANSNHILFIP